MEQFAHLRLVTNKTGLAALTGGGADAEETKANKADRKGHSGKLQRWLTDIKTDWEGEFAEREQNQLAPLDQDVVTVFFQINPDLLLPTFDLEAFGIEIISEEEDGFIIGASTDNFRSIEAKITGFVTEEYGSAKVGDLWKIIDGDRGSWRAEHILSETLFARWKDIRDDDLLKLDVSIAFAKPLGARPDPDKRGGPKRLEEYQRLFIERDDALIERQTHFENFVKFYKGKIPSGLIDFDDSFSAKVEISGLGFKDLVRNYPFVFEVVETEEAGIGGTDSQEMVLDGIEILPPPEGAPIVGVIDSGIMEGHKYLAPAIDVGRSSSYLKGDGSTADYVPSGGHGTKVAGAVLFPKGISSLTSPFSPPCFIRNLRVLDKDKHLLEVYPAQLMQQIVADNDDCKLYNLSVTASAPFRIKHMSSWAAMIDKLIHTNDVLFVLSVGNITFGTVSSYLRSGVTYPAYLEQSYCRIANPAQSSFGISVGSIDHIDFHDASWRSVGGNGLVSGYSRIGRGMWGQIKPDLVEYGGGIVASQNGLSQIATNSNTATELVLSTLHGGPAIGTDVGTSYSAPKVTHIAAVLKSLYPDEGVNLIRALLVQGARLPGDLFYTPTDLGMRQLGYGLPSIERVTSNTDYRATFYSTGLIAANEGHIYSLRIPESLRNPGNEYDVLVEVTLAYTAKVRRTRQRLKSYLATWLDWTSSRFEEKFDGFSERALKPEDGSKRAKKKNENGKTIQWKIRERSDLGDVTEMNRNQGSLQKDWVILKSHQMPEELSFAVRGHKGWDKDFEQIPYAFTVSIEVLGAEIPIYEEIRIENEVEIEIKV